MTNISLLIAISVGMVYFGILFMGLASIPNLRASFAGIPIKMAGFIYGPVVGLMTGAIADILGLLVFPTFFHPGYTFNLMLAGFFPGLVGMLYRKYKAKDQTIAIICNLIIFTLFALVLGLYMENQVFDSIVPPSSQDVFNFGLMAYSIQMFVTLILFNVGYIWVKNNKPSYTTIYMLLSLSVLITDNVGIFLVPLWDQKTIGIEYISGLSLSMLYFGIKMWFNIVLLFIIFSILDKQISRQTEFNKETDMKSVRKEKQKEKQKEKWSKGKIR